MFKIKLFVVRERLLLATDNVISRFKPLAVVKCSLSICQYCESNGYLTVPTTDFSFATVFSAIVYKVSQH